MRRICSILLVLLSLFALKAQAEALTNPDPTKTYNIKHTSQLYLTVDGNSLRINQLGEGLQKYTVEIAGTDDEGTTIYNIKTEDGRYVGSDNGYTHVFLSDPTDPFAQYTIWESHEDGYAKLWNVGRGAYMGSDQNTPGAGVYSDKNGYDGKHCWAFVEAVEGVVYDALESAIANAETVLAEAPIGAETGFYPQAAADALSAAIATAKGFLSSQDQKEVNQASSDLNAAVSTFYTQKIVFLPKEGALYYFFNEYTGCVMALDSNIAKIMSISGDASQKWEIVPVEGSNIAFNLKCGDSFLTRKGGWDTSVSTDNTANETKFELEPIDLEQAVYRIKKFNEWGYMATDETAPGSWIYTNKGTSATSVWQIIEAVEGEVLTIGLEKAIEKAEAAVAEAVIGEEPWNYPQAAKDAYEVAIAAAKSGTYTTQEEVNAASEALAQAGADFAAARIMPWFSPAAGTAYRFSINKYESKYLTAGDADAKTTADFEAGNTAQHWTFQKVARNTFILKNGDRVLAHDGSLVTVADAEAPLWYTVYTNTRNNIDYFALLAGEDGKVLTFSSGKTMAFQDLDKGNTAHQGRFLRVDPANDPNLSALEAAVAAARATLAGIDRGSAIGQYSDAKCKAFEAEIVKAETLAGMTQEEADAAAEALNTARTEFINNPNTVIKDALNAAIAAGLAKAEAAQVGIEAGEFYMSAIEDFKALMADYQAKGNEVSEQEDCDALTAEVEKAVEEFTGNTEVQAAADVLADYIIHCEALYEAEKDNVGDNFGQRPQEVVDAFLAAINTAKAVENANINDLRALIDARTAFISGSVSVNRTPLREAIAKAEGEAYTGLVAGDFDGQYPAEAISTFNDALAAAKAADTDMSMTQEEVTAAAAALTEAMKALDKARVTIDFKTFDAALAAAKAALAGATVVGDEEGACPQAVYDALKNEIDKAEAINRAAISQADVDAAAAALAEETSTFSAKLHESAGLDAVITTAKELVDDAEEGLTPGCYPVSAISGLNEAIAAAEAVNADAAATQAQLLDAVRALNEAMISFKAQQIPANDLTEINATIAEAETFIAETGCDDFVLSSALDYAKDVVANADNYTKAQVKKANDELREALDYAKEAGIYAVAAEGIVIRTAAGEVIVEGVSAAARVVIYSVDGRVIADGLAEGGVYTKALSAGAYVVTVSAEGTAVSRTVIVK